MDYFVNFEEISNKIYNQNVIKSLLGDSHDVRFFIDNIENLDLAIDWIKDGNDLEEFYLLEQNKCDLKLAFEINRIIKILK